MTLSPLNGASRREDCCRSCGSRNLQVFLDLGAMPLADRLVDDPQAPEPRFPLEVAFCHDCALVQILETVDPAILFADDYPYYSSFSPALLEHARRNALARMEDRGLGASSLVAELASNDGYLLKNYAERDIRVLGIDPAEGPAKAAIDAGVPTDIAFFGHGYAKQVVARVGQADVVHANNVLAHVADTNDFVAGIGALLKPDGVAVIEMPYLKSLIDHVEFDTIYHEHLCYFSLTALDRLFRRFDLFVNDVEQLTIHGGSLRIFVEKDENPSAEVTGLLAQEHREGLDSFAYFDGFSKQVEALRQALTDTLSKLLESGASVAAYGAAAKGATLLNFCKIGAEQLAFVADRNTHKQGKHMPGCGLKIEDPGALLRQQPDYVLILAWNFAEEIMAQQQEYRERGGRFVIPVPEVRIV